MIELLKKITLKIQKKKFKNTEDQGKMRYDLFLIWNLEEEPLPRGHFPFFSYL